MPPVPARNRLRSMPSFLLATSLRLRERAHIERADPHRARCGRLPRIVRFRSIFLCSWASPFRAPTYMTDIRLLPARGHNRALEFGHFNELVTRESEPTYRIWHFVGSTTRCEYRREGHSPPCTKARRGGRAIKKAVAKPPIIAQTGWFSDREKRKTTPSASASVASRHLLMTQTPILASVQRGE